MCPVCIKTERVMWAWDSNVLRMLAAGVVVGIFVIDCQCKLYVGSAAMLSCRYSIGHLCACLVKL